MSNAEIFTRLLAQFEPGSVRIKVLGGRQVRYVTARTVMNRLDEVVGPWNWWDTYEACDRGVVCHLTIRLPDGETITKTDAGGFTKMPDAANDEKSGFSSAFKRAAVKFGIARYLYGDGIPRFAGVPAPSSRQALARPGNGTEQGQVPRKATDPRTLAKLIQDGVDATNYEFGKDREPGEVILNVFEVQNHLLKFLVAGGTVPDPGRISQGQRYAILEVHYATPEGRKSIRQELAVYLGDRLNRARAEAAMAAENHANDDAATGGEVEAEELAQSGREPGEEG